MSGKLLIVDGNSILNRAFYAIKGPSMLTTREGVYTNAVFGFITILNKYLEEEQPDYIGVAFDMKAKTFRHLMCEDYKATRKGMPTELVQQLPIVKNVLKAMAIPVIEKEGIEADDIIGIYSKAAEDHGLEVAILTGDRDALQLVSEKVSVIIPTTSKGKTETTRYTPTVVFEKYGLEPRTLIDLKALMGDSSDNIKGVPGVGEKTAIELLKQFGTLDDLYENLQQVSREKLRANLESGKESAYLSRTLGTILRQHDELRDIEMLRRAEMDRGALLELFRELEFNLFIKKMGLEDVEAPGANGGELAARPTVPVTTPEELVKLVSDLKREEQAAFYPYIEKSGRIGGSLVALSVGARGKHYFIKPGEGLPESEIALSLGELFKSPGLLVIFLNLKEFYLWLLSHGLDLKCRMFDLMIAEYLLDAQANAYTIDLLTSKHLNLELSVPEAIKGKGKHTVSELASDELSAFGAKAISVFEAIFEKQSAILEDSGQNVLYYEVELPLALVLANMEHDGFKVDAHVLEDYGDMLDKRIRTLEQSIFMLAGETFNINSPKQLGVILFEKLGLKAGKKTKTGYSTDAEVLEELSDKHEIIPFILEYRQLVKLKSTYAEGLIKVINPTTGRIHSSFNQTVTATGRISSTEPNLQNIPIRTELGREIRRAFVPEEGYTFVDADYSQIELRVLAHITDDAMLKKAFLEGVDIHSLTASQVFNIPVGEVTGEMRRRAKAVNFGIVYGISDFSLAKDINVTKKEAARYIDGYLSTYPKVRDYMEETVKTGTEKGYVETLFHRIRYIPELKSSNFALRSFGKRIAMNTPIQGSAADIIKIAMVRVWRELRKKGLKSRLILQVHDELLVETLKEELEQVRDIIRTNMEAAVRLSVPLIADVSTGSNWYEAK